MSQLSAAAPAWAQGPHARLRTGLWQRLPVVLRYGVAGAATQVIYLCVLMTALWGGVHYLAGLLIAQLAAICFAFPVYRTRVFESKASVGRQLAQFMSVWWTGATLSLVGVPALVEIGGVDPLPAQFMILLFVVSASFLAHRNMTFRRGL